MHNCGPVGAPFKLWFGGCAVNVALILVCICSMSQILQKSECLQKSGALQFKAFEEFKTFCIGIKSISTEIQKNVLIVLSIALEHVQLQCNHNQGVIARRDNCTSTVKTLSHHHNVTLQVSFHQALYGHGCCIELNISIFGMIFQNYQKSYSICFKYKKCSLSSFPLPSMQAKEMASEITVYS